MVRTFEDIATALRDESQKLRAVDIYLNDKGKRRLSACVKIRNMMDFCSTATELLEANPAAELGDEASAVSDVLHAINRIAKGE